MKSGIPAENETSLLFALPVLNRMIWSSADLRRFGFTKTQLMVFSVLSYWEVLSMGEVAAYISSSKEQTSRAVAQLVEEGYVHREIDSKNRTRVRISLTERGRVLVAECRSEFMENLNTRLNRNLTKQEVAEFRTSAETILILLGKMGEN